MTLDSYKAQLCKSIVNNDPLGNYKIITDYKPKDKNEGTFAIVKFTDNTNKHIILCKGSLIKPIEDYYRLAGVYHEVCDSATKVYGKGNLKHRNKLKTVRVTIEGIEYDKLTEDYAYISLFGAVTISNLTHGDYKLVHTLNKDTYIDKYRLTSNRYLGAIVYDEYTIYGKITEQGILDDSGKIIDVDSVYKESVYCGVYKISMVYRRIA